MSRKTYKAGVAALAVAMVVTFASAEGSGANAQQGENQQVETDAAAEEVVPQFTSREVVQPLPVAPQAAAEAEADVEAVSPRQASSLRELVASTPTGGALSDQMECLAGAIYFEARGEPLEGQLAVGQVIVNRTESDSFPSSYCGVVMQRKQFSFVRGGHMPRINRSSPAWLQAKAVARIAHDGSWDSKAQDALYFHARYVRPAWSYRKVATATISSHIFYR
ncbi:MAG: cell wall hydrolase [Sphingomonadales bacterium]|nr:cell wall hydrolase [Sphingomonadales bacterium]MBD3773634.1 cell wall hydrolase [Paracoccaceae bacterium]